jgi:hypothetical protein
MVDDPIGKNARFDDKVDGHNVEIGAIEPSFQFSPSAEKRLVWKIDLM